MIGVNYFLSTPTLLYKWDLNSLVKDLLHTANFKFSTVRRE